MGDKPWDTDPSKRKELGENAKDGRGLQPKDSMGADPKPVARFILDKYSCPKYTPIFLVPIKPAKFFVDYMLVIRLGDFGIDDNGILEIVTEGARDFTVCGLPVSRKDDGMQHKGLILSGSPNFAVGGPKWSLPQNIHINGGVEYTSKVMRDMYFLSTTKTGRELLDRTAAHGQPVNIDGFTTAGAATPDDPDKLGKQQPTGTTIHYDPDADNTYSYDEKGNKIPNSPQVTLGHELAHSVHFGEGKGYTASSTEEANTVGYDPRSLGGGLPGRGGSKAAKKPWVFPGPTENDLRKDLGLPARGKYGGDTWDQHAKNYRPGDCP